MYEGRAERGMKFFDRFAELRKQVDGQRNRGVAPIYYLSLIHIS